MLIGFQDAFWTQLGRISLAIRLADQQILFQKLGQGSLLGCSWCFLCTSWVALGASWEPLGVSWQPVGGLLAACWHLLAASWVTWRTREAPGELLGQSLGDLGVVFTGLGAILDRSGVILDHLGTAWGHLVASDIGPAGGAKSVVLFICAMIFAQTVVVLVSLSVEDEAYPTGVAKHTMMFLK
jgi:hypothetical protein